MHKARQAGPGGGRGGELPLPGEGSVRVDSCDLNARGAGAA
jgi:hypothetical protein